MGDELPSPMGPSLQQSTEKDLPTDEVAHLEFLTFEKKKRKIVYQMHKRRKIIVDKNMVETRKL